MAVWVCIVILDCILSQRNESLMVEFQAWWIMNGDLSVGILCNLSEAFSLQSDFLSDSARFLGGDAGMVSTVFFS